MDAWEMFEFEFTPFPVDPRFEIGNAVYKLGQLLGSECPGSYPGTRRNTDVMRDGSTRLDGPPLLWHGSEVGSLAYYSTGC